MAVRVIPANMGGAEPLAAAAGFHSVILPEIEAVLGSGDSVIVRFDHAEEKPHRWRNEAIAALARKYAPLRVNAVVPAFAGAADERIETAVAFLSENEGVTGQLLIAG